MKMFREMADVVWQFQSGAVDDKDAVTLHKSIYVINLEMFWSVDLTMILFLLQQQCIGCNKGLFISFNKPRGCQRIA